MISDGSSLPGTLLLVAYVVLQMSHMHPKLNRFQSDLLTFLLKQLPSMLFLLANGTITFLLRPETWELVQTAPPLHYPPFPINHQILSIAFPQYSTAVPTSQLALQLP